MVPDICFSQEKKDNHILWAFVGILDWNKLDKQKSLGILAFKELQGHVE